MLHNLKKGKVQFSVDNTWPPHKPVHWESAEKIIFVDAWRSFGQVMTVMEFTQTYPTANFSIMYSNNNYEDNLKKCMDFSN